MYNNMGDDIIFTGIMVKGLHAVVMFFANFAVT